MTKRGFLCLLLLLGVALAGHGQKNTPPVEKDIYIFGFAHSFADSVAFATDVQPLRAYVQSNGFLANRSLYSLQLENYMIGTQHRENMTCAVFFGKNRAKVEKKYQKVSRRARENNVGELRMLSGDEFRFVPEELSEEPLVYGEEAPAPKEKKQKKTKKSK